MSVFYPGSTPSHTFKIPFKGEDCSLASVSYKQGGKTILTKRCAIFEPVETDATKCTITIDFSQAETLRFADNKDISIEINLITNDRKRHVSKPFDIRAGEQYERRVIGYG